MSIAGYGRGVSWVSHKRESSLSTLPSASPPSSRTSFSHSSNSPGASPELNKDRALFDESHPPPDSHAEFPQPTTNDSGLKSLYGIRTIAMRRESSHSVTSSISNSSHRTKPGSPELNTTAAPSEDGRSSPSLELCRSPSGPEALKRGARPSFHSDRPSHFQHGATEEPSESCEATASCSAEEGTLDATQTTTTTTEPSTPVRTPTALPSASPSPFQAETSASPPANVAPSSLDSAVEDAFPSSPESSSRPPPPSRRASALALLQHKRRLASAPFGRPVSPSRELFTGPAGTQSTVASPLPTPHHSPKIGQGLSLPFYGRSGRRVRSRHPSRSNSELQPLSTGPPPPLLPADPSSSTMATTPTPRLSSSFSLSDLNPLRTQHLHTETDSLLLTPRDVLMTPTTEEWAAYGGKVGSSKLVLRHGRRMTEGLVPSSRSSGDSSSGTSSSSSSSGESDDDDDDDDDKAALLHLPRRTHGEALLHDRAQGLSPEPTSTSMSTLPQQPTRPKPDLPSTGFTSMDVPTLNRTASADKAVAMEGPVSLQDTGPVDPKRYSAVTGLRNINSFSVQREAGAGAYGSVVQATEIATGTPIIIKCVVKQRILADCWKKHRILGPIPVEIHVLDQLRRIAYSSLLRPPHHQGPHPSTGHPNLCSLLDFWEDDENYYLCMPVFGVGQDLFDHVDEYPDGLPMPELKSILAQIAAGVAFLHMNGMVHRDIKDENVILDGQGNAALIDFGSAAYYKENQLFDTFSGTLDFAAPEVLHGERYDATKTDVWAFGVLAYVLICGECPFWHSDEAVHGLKPGTRASAALDEKVRHQSNLSQAIDLVRRCVEVEACDRPSAQEICRHAFFAAGGWSGRLGWKQQQQQQQQQQQKINTHHE